MRNGLYSIGDFSRMCRLTVKALRLYDEQGILKPGHTDPSTGYRYYSSAQLAEANLVRMLRSLEMPLEEIKWFLREEGPESRKALLEQHRREVESRLESYRSIAASIERIIEEEEGIMARNVEVKELPAQPILCVRFNTAMSEIGDNIGKAYESLFTYLGKAGDFPAGPPFSVYHDHEYKEEDMDVESCVPTARLLPGEENVKARELPGGKVASTLHVGSYDGIGNTHRELAMWVSENGYRLSGPCREVYLVGPGQPGEPSPSEYRTEIIYPIDEAE